MPDLQALAGIPSFSQQIGEALSSGVSQGLSEALAGYQKHKQMAQQTKALKDFGIDVPQGFSNLPEQVQKSIVQDQLFQKLLGSGQGNQPSAGQQPGMPQQGNESGFAKLNDRQLSIAMANPLYGQAAKAEFDRRTRAQSDIRKSDISRSTKFLEGIDTERDNLIRQKSSLLAAEDAINSKDMGFFSLDNLARIPGLEGLASKEAGILNASSKTFFLGDLQTAVGRPNMFLERILSNAIFGVGKSNEANLALVDFYKNQVDLKEKKIEIASQLEDFYREKLGYVPGNISKLVDDQLKPYAKEKEKELVKRFKGTELAKGIKEPEEEGKKSLSQEKAIEFLNQAKGDKEKARKIARQQGFEF